MRQKQLRGRRTGNTQSRAQKPHVCAENLKKNVMFPFAVLLRFINLAASITYRKPPMGRGWADIYITKGVTDALVLTIRELRNFNCLSRTKQWGRPIGCIICSPHWLRTLRAFVAGVDTLYIYIGVGLPALLVSTDRAMRRPTNRGTGNRLAPRFAFCISHIQFFFRLW